MEYIYAAMLLHKLGKEINEASVKKVLEAAGAKVEDARVKALVSALDGVDIESAIKEAAMPVMAAAPAGISAVSTEAHKEEKKEHKEEKKSTEEAAAGLGALFG